MKTKRICTLCRARLDVGVNCWATRQGVMGNERFIPLEEKSLFCSEECVHRHFNGSMRLTRKLP